MTIFRKAFLFVVGALTIASDEASKSVDEAVRFIQERRPGFLR